MKFSVPVAATVSATTSMAAAFPNMHLVVQRTSSGSRVVARSIPSNNEFGPTDFGALFVLYHLYRYISSNPDIESWETGIFRNTGMAVDTWLHSLSYLLDANTWKLVLPVIAPEVFPSDKERLALLAQSQHAVASRTKSISQYFFNRGCRYQAYEVGCLVDAAFNADFATVKALLENSRRPDILLSISADVLVDGYPDIVRRGTALQLALRSGDTEMVDLMARFLPPSEFIRQFESVFGTDFAAFERKQKEDAVKLFESLEDAFNSASSTEISNALDHVPGTSSVLHTKLAAFKLALEKYVLENPNHNDFFLAKAYEIYEKNWKLWAGDQRCLFSQQIIGLVQANAKKTSSFRLQDYAQGIYYRGENNEAAARGYNLRRTSVDIRSLANLGSTSNIDILGTRSSGAFARWWAVRTVTDVGGRGLGAVEKLCRAKTDGFQNVMRRAREHLRSQSDGPCCVVQ